jgi:hypothetical protein
LIRPSSCPRRGYAPPCAVPGYLARVPLIIFIPHGKAFGATPAAAQERGEVTLELTAAFRDPAVEAARNGDLLGVAFILAMMIFKRF